MDLPTPPPSTDTPGHQVVDQPLRLLEPMDIELPSIPSTSAFTLLTTPPIPWPQPTPASTSLHLQTGGRHWPIASSSSSTAREEYLEALYLPDPIYPFTDLVHSLKGKIDESFLLPVPAISQKHRKVLPPLLSTLLSENPPHSIGSEESVAEDEWRAFKSGFGVRLGSRGLGVAGKGKEGESEEERNERRSAEEEVWVREGKEWVEGLERRETLLQVLFHFILPPPAAAISIAALPKKRSRKSTKSTTSSGSVDLAHSLMALTDRLSIWQALSTLGVDALSLNTPKGKERASIDWVQQFYLDVVESNFSTSHPGFCHLLASSLLPAGGLSRPVKPAPSRSLVLPEAPPSSAATPPPAASTSMTVWPAAPPQGGSSRRKGKARQLPEDANKYQLVAAAAQGAGGGKAMSRTNSLSGPLRAFNRSLSTTADPVDKTKLSSHTTALGRASSLGPPMSLSSIGSRSTSLGPTASSSNTTPNVLQPRAKRAPSAHGLTRSTSQGPESQTEKLMRRSVSFTKGAGVGRKLAGGTAKEKDKKDEAAAAAAATTVGRKGLGKIGGWGARVKGGSPVGEGDKGMVGKKDGQARTSTFLVPETPVKPTSKNLVMSTPVGAMPTFVAETPPGPEAGASQLGKDYRLGEKGWLGLGRVVEGEEESLGEFFESDGE